MWWRNVAMVYAIVFLAIGIAGFIPGLVTLPIQGVDLAIEGGHGRLFGLFPVNWLHNLFHAAWGLYGFYAYFTGRIASRTFLRVTAVVYAVLTVFGFIPLLSTVFGLIPVYGHDIWLHAVLAIVAAYVGWFVHDREAEAEHAARTRRV